MPSVRLLCSDGAHVKLDGRTARRSHVLMHVAAGPAAVEVCVPFTSTVVRAWATKVVPDDPELLLATAKVSSQLVLCVLT